MRSILLSMLTLVYISDVALGQNSQTVISVESRVGYSTNTYLNPFFGELDTSVESGYGVVSVLGQSFWYKNNNLIEVSGGLIAEPFLDNQQTWKGGLGVARYQRRFSGQFTAGVEAGASYFASSFDRGIIWAQPYLIWSPGSFTLFRLKAGPNFRSYRNFQDSLNTFSSQRTDLYALEFETWPTFHWHLKAGLYGQLETLPSVDKSFSSVLSAGYVFRNGAQLRLQLGLQQYDLPVTTESGGGGPVFPPSRPPRGSTQTEIETDRIIQMSLTGDYPVTHRWSLFVRADMMDYSSTTTNEPLNDVNLSGGVRFSFEPGIRKGRGNAILPEWDKEEGQQIFRIHYKGGGRLYLTGDFNNWEQPGIPLTEQSQNTFVSRLNLEPGAYEYKVLRINGTSEEWIEFSKNSYTVADGFGGENALLLVEY